MSLCERVCRGKEVVEVGGSTAALKGSRVSECQAGRQVALGPRYPSVRVCVCFFCVFFFHVTIHVTMHVPQYDSKIYCKYSIFCTVNPLTKGFSQGFGQLCLKRVSHALRCGP